MHDPKKQWSLGTRYNKGPATNVSAYQWEIDFAQNVFHFEHII